MNKSVVLGLLGGIAVVVASILISTKTPLIFIHSVAGLIIFGGIFCVSMVARSFSGNMQMALKIWYIVRSPAINHHDLIKEIISVAQKNSASNFLLYEKDMKDIKNGMVREAVELVGMGYRPEEIRKFLTLRLESTQSNLLGYSASLLSLGKMCPAFGLLGTLVGLIILLYNMGSGHIEEVGPAMAISLTATLYGVFLANVILTPLADFIFNYAEAVRIQDEMILESAVMLKERRHHIQVLELLKSYIPRYEQDALNNYLQTNLKTRTAGAKINNDKKDENVKEAA